MDVYSQDHNGKSEEVGEQWENRFGKRKHQVQEYKYRKVDKLQKINYWGSH